MKQFMTTLCVVALVAHITVTSIHAHSGPFDGQTFKGWIAFSSDGNFNDEDDWGAFPTAMAILDAFGLTEELVHVDYCNILKGNDPHLYRERYRHAET